MTADYHYQLVWHSACATSHGESLAGRDDLRETQEDVLSMHSASAHHAFPAGLLNRGKEAMLCEDLLCN